MAGATLPLSPILLLGGCGTAMNGATTVNGEKTINARSIDKSLNKVPSTQDTLVKGIGTGTDVVFEITYFDPKPRLIDANTLEFSHDCNFSVGMTVRFDGDGYDRRTAERHCKERNLRVAGSMGEDGIFNLRESHSFTVHLPTPIEQRVCRSLALYLPTPGLWIFKGRDGSTDDCLSMSFPILPVADVYEIREYPDWVSPPWGTVDLRKK